MVLEAGEDESLERDADHESLLIRGGLSEGEQKLRNDLVVPV